MESEIVYVNQNFECFILLCNAWRMGETAQFLS